MTTSSNGAYVIEQVLAEVASAPTPEFLPKGRDEALFEVKRRLYRIWLGEGGKKKILRQIGDLIDKIERS